MLSKLLKYELKATSRIFLPIYAVLLVFALINKAINSLSMSEMHTPQMISMAVYVIILVGMFVMTYVVMIQRFYRNLLSDEGYLMNTLPTTSWKHITSKLLISMMWMLASMVSALVSIVIISYNQGFYADFWQAFTNAMNDFFRALNISGVVFTVEALIAGLVSLASTVLIIYASIAIGHLFNQHRVLASLGAFLALNTVSQILFAIAGSIPVLNNLPTNIDTVNELQAFAPVIHFAIWFCAVFFGILCAGYFVITNYILSKRLNLE